MRERGQLWVKARRFMPLLVFAIFLVLAFLVFVPVWLDPSNRSIGIAVGGTRDKDLFMWFLGWGAFALPHGHNPFYSAFIDYPGGVNLMWNTAIPLPATLLAPVTWRLGPTVAYNLLETLAPALSGLAAFVLIRRYVQTILPAALGAAIYGFSPFIMAASLGHPSFSLACVPPLIFLALDHLLLRPGQRPIAWGVFLGVLGVAQLLISEEYLLTSGLIALAVLIIAAWNHRDSVLPRLRSALPGLAVAFLTFIVLGAYPLFIQFFGPQHLSGGLAHPMDVYTNDTLSLFLPTRLQWLSPGFLASISDRFIGNATESGAYFGLPLIGVLVYTAIRYWHDEVVRVASLGGSLVALLSLGYTVKVAGHGSRVPVLLLALIFPLLSRFLPGTLMLFMTAIGWLALDRFPLIRNALPARMSLYLFLFAGLLFAIFVERVMRGAIPRLAGAGAALLTIVTLVPAIPYPYTSQQAPPFFASPALDSVGQDSVALVVPFAGHRKEAAMFWQAVAGMRFKMPEAYAFIPGDQTFGINSYNPPPSPTRDYLWALQDGSATAPASADVEQSVRNDLTRWNVRAVIVGPMNNEDQAVAFFTQLTGSQPQTTGGVYLWLLQ